MGRPKKVEKFKVVRFKNSSGTVAWRVSGTLPDGTRVRKNFPQKADAINFKAELELAASENPTEAVLRPTRLSVDQLADAETAAEVAGDRSLSEIVHSLHSLERAAGDQGVSVHEMVRFFQQHYRAEIKSISVLNAYNRFLESGRTVEFINALWITTRPV
jgi:hypothetical protein